MVYSREQVRTSKIRMSKVKKNIENLKHIRMSKVKLDFQRSDFTYDVKKDQNVESQIWLIFKFW
jgi:hypothetical protein